MDEFEFFDYSKYNQEDGDSWLELWDEGLTLAENLNNILKDAVILPDADLQVPLAIAYMMIPSALAKIVPILFCHGQRGSGKSTIGLLASLLHNAPIHTSGDTFAAIRNSLDAMKWIEPTNRIGEKNCILIWDDIDSDLLIQKPDIYRMLKYGYDKNSDTIQIATANGQNLKFRVFSPKITSSIQSIYSDPRFPELQRRAMVIKTKRYEMFTKEEKAKSALDESFHVTEKLDLKAINWTGFDANFRTFWSDVDNVETFVNTRRKLSRKNRKIKIPDTISGEQWIISVDLLATGVTLKLWNHIEEAVEFIARYWTWYREQVDNVNSATIKLLAQFIEEETRHARGVNEAMGYEIIKLSVSPERLKKKLDEHAHKGELDITAKPAVIVSCMAQLGWRLEPGMWVVDS